MDQTDTRRTNMDHNHDADHGHGMDPHARLASKRRLLIAFVLVTGYMVVEVVAGYISGSLALLAAAGHMLADSAAIGLALVAAHFADRTATADRTFGYHRLEVLAALVNALTLWLIAAGVMVEANESLHEHAHEHVEGGLLLGVGVVGLAVNLSVAAILHGSARLSLNVEGVFRHVVADLLGAVAVVVSGVLVVAFGWTAADPVLSVVIGVLILFSTWRLLAKVVRVLLEGTPEHIDVYRLCSEMEDVEGVALIHDIHVWSIVPGYEALTAHVLVDPDYKGGSSRLLQQLRQIATGAFRIDHVTIQLDDSVSNCTEHHHVDHLHARARPSKRTPQSG